MSSASWALQQAVFALLSASGEIKDVLGDPPRLFDAPPRDTAFPYAVIGDGREAEWNTATEKGSEHQFAVTVWSRSGGHKETKEIAGVIQNELDDASLALTGFVLVSLFFLACDFASEADGETYRVTLRFRAALENG